MKPYQQITILECGEPLVAIPETLFPLISPHPYEKLGAPYGGQSPFYLRQGVLDRLTEAQTFLQQNYPGWLILVFDAYRPVAVQQYMVDHTFQELVQAQGLTPDTMTPAQRQEVLARVYEFWAIPNLDPAQPPPHSTGAALDVTLIDQQGQLVDMGSPIDEVSPRSHPNYFSQSNDPTEQACDRHRQILHSVMTKAGFRRHLNEWWHFSMGDQLWAWLISQEQPGQVVTAQYGRV